LGRSLRSIADLARLASVDRDYRAQLDHAVRSRSAVYQELAAALRLSAESALEPDAAQAREERDGLRQLTAQAQAVFLAVLTLLRHRIAPGFPEPSAPVRDAMREIDRSIGDTLEALAERLERRSERELPDLQERLAALEALIPSEESDAALGDASATVRVAAHDHAAIVRDLVKEVGLLREGIDAVVARRVGRPLEPAVESAYPSK